MKKLGIILFASALVVGIVVSNLFSFGRLSDRLAHFSFDIGGVRGSGNVIKESRDVRGFQKVEVGGIFQVEIVTGSEYRVEVEADDNLVPLIETEVNGDTLSIDTNQRVSGKSTLKVRITAPNVDAIEASGASSVAMSGVNVDRLSVSASGASKVSAAGEVRDLNIELSGASRIKADSLKTTNATVDASGASNAELNVTGDLVSDLSGASRVVYSGTPTNVQTKKSGGSTVSSR